MTGYSSDRTSTFIPTKTAPEVIEACVFKASRYLERFKNLTQKRADLHTLGAAEVKPGILLTIDQRPAGAVNGLSDIDLLSVLSQHNSGLGL